MRRLLRQLRHVRRGEGGQVLIIVAVGMVLMLVLAAVVVDGGHAFVEKRSLQNAADAASLAAAGKLPVGGGLTCVHGTVDVGCAAVKTAVQDYLGFNGYSTLTITECNADQSIPTDAVVQSMDEVLKIALEREIVALPMPAAPGVEVTPQPEEVVAH